jgi:hypothetical protein
MAGYRSFKHCIFSLMSKAVLPALAGGVGFGAALGQTGTTSSVTAETVNGVVNVNLLSGTDIGAQINSFLASGSSSTLLIPDGIYNFSTPVSGSLASAKNLHIMCASRAAILNFTGTSGDAFYFKGATALNNNLLVENCTLNYTGGGSSVNGLHLQAFAGARFRNNSISNFSGSSVLLQGSINGHFDDNDLMRSGAWNVMLEEDTATSINSNMNIFTGGSIQYGGLATAKTGNILDKGVDGTTGGDTGNIFNAVTIETSGSAPQAIFESTLNDAIEHSYLECYNCTTAATSPVYDVILGNYSGSGYGSNAAATAADFSFENNYVTSYPVATASGGAAAIYAINAPYLRVGGGEIPGGSTNYVVNYYSSGNNIQTSSYPFYAVLSSGGTPYLNVPVDAQVWSSYAGPQGQSGYGFGPYGNVFNNAALIGSLAFNTTGAGIITTGSTTSKLIGIVTISSGSLSGSTTFSVPYNAASLCLGNPQVVLPAGTTWSMSSSKTAVTAAVSAVQSTSTNFTYLCVGFAN